MLYEMCLPMSSLAIAISDNSSSLKTLPGVSLDFIRSLGPLFLVLLRIHDACTNARVSEDCGHVEYQKISGAYRIIATHLVLRHEALLWPSWSGGTLGNVVIKICERRYSSIGYSKRSSLRGLVFIEPWNLSSES